MLVLSRDPNDTGKTKFTMIIHANPGGGLPLWASFISLFVKLHLS